MLKYKHQVSHIGTESPLALWFRLLEKPLPTRVSSQVRAGRAGASGLPGDPKGPAAPDR